MEFLQENPPISDGVSISLSSFDIIEKELVNYPKIKEFNSAQKEIIKRLIHTTTCFEEVLENIYFSDDAATKITKLLKNGAKIVVDVHMVKAGLSEFYLKEYGNDVVCYINDPQIYELSKKRNTTRTYAAVVEAIKKNRDKPMIFVCGNAPTFIYGAINTLLDEGVDLKNIAFLLFPVGFVNVVESKNYAKRFCEHFDVPVIIMGGRFGSSTMAVATLHALYKEINDFDKDQKYNGK